MRPLEGHWELPDGCFCCCCRPFPVGKLDGPLIGSVSLFREIPRLGSKSRLELVDPTDSTSCLLLLDLLLPVVAIQVLTLVFSEGLVLREG